MDDSELWAYLDTHDYDFNQLEGVEKISRAIEAREWMESKDYTIEGLENLLALCDSSADPAATENARKVENFLRVARYTVPGDP